MRGGCVRHPVIRRSLNSETSRRSVVLFPADGIARMFLARVFEGRLNGGSAIVDTAGLEAVV